MDAQSFIDSPPPQMPEGVVVVYGNEDFLQRQVLGTLRQTFQGEGEEFGLVRFRGPEAELAQVLDELATPPLFARRRLVIVDEADEFVSRYREPLLRYVQQPSRWATLVLVVRSWPSTTHLAKALSRRGVAIPCRAPKAYELPRWLSRWATRAYGKKLSPTAAELLVDSVGTNLGVLDRELEKLAGSVGQRSAINEADVERLVAGSAERTAWQMIDALAEGRTSESLEVLDSLLRRSEPPVAILGALSWHLRSLARAARLVENGHSISTALQQAGVKPFAVQRAAQHLRRLGKKRVRALYDWLLETDLDLKGQRAVPPQLALETMLVRLAAAD